MNDQAINNTRIQLSGFIQLLKSRGFIITPDHYFELNALLNEINLEKIALPALADYLCPIFAKEKKQQKEFHQFYRIYFKDYLEDKEIPDPDVDLNSIVSNKVQSTAKTPTLKHKLKYQDRFWFQAILGLLLFVLIGAIGYLLFTYSLQHIKEYPNRIVAVLELILCTSIAVGLLISFFVGVVVQMRWYWSLLFVILFFNWQLFNKLISGAYQLGFWKNVLAFFVVNLFVVVFHAFFDNRGKQKEIIKRRPPYFYRPIVEMDKIQLINNQEGHEASLPIVNAQIRAEVIDEIDLLDTLDETVRNAGFLKLVNKRRLPEANYMMLIDHAGISSHQQEWYDYIYQTLKEHGAPISRYYFDSDPNHIWSKNGKSIKLADTFNRQRLLVFGSGESFIDPILAEPYQWAKDTFDSWTKEDLCGLLTPVVPQAWDYKEEALAELFEVAPATIDGLHEVVQTFDEDSTRDKNYWMEEDSSRPFNTEDIAVLKEQIPENVFHWVCAVATFPRIYWDLTLYIGKALEINPGDLLNRENVDIVTRLEWISKGEMSIATRRKLLAELPDEKELTVRSALKRLLRNSENSTNRPPVNSYAWEEYKLQVLRNEIVVSNNPGEQMKKIERLKNMLEESESEWTLLEELVKQRRDRIKNLQWKVQHGIMSFSTFPMAFTFNRLKFPDGKLETELQIRLRRTKYEPQLGDLIQQYSDRKETNFSAGLDPESQNHLPSLIREAQMPIKTRRVNRVNLTKSFDRDEILSFLKYWELDNIPNLPRTEEVFELALVNVSIEEFDIKGENKILPFDDSKMRIIWKNSIAEYAMPFYNLMYLSDYLNLSNFHWRTINSIVKCGFLEIRSLHKDGSLLEERNSVMVNLGIDSGEPKTIGYTTREVLFDTESLTISEKGQGSLNRLFQKNTESIPKGPASQDSKEISYIGSPNNPEFPAPGRKAGETVLLPSEILKAQSLIWWNQRLFPTIEIAFDIKINLYSAVYDDKWEDGFSVVLAKEKFVPEKGRIAGYRELEKFISETTAYRLQFKTLKPSSVGLIVKGKPWRNVMKIEQEIGRAVWYSYKVRFGRESVQAWVNDEEVLNSSMRLPREYFNAGIFAQTDKSSGLMRIRNFSVLPIDEDIAEAKSEQLSNEAISQKVEAIHEEIGREPVKVYVTYSRTDDSMYQEFSQHLRSLEQYGIVELKLEPNTNQNKVDLTDSSAKMKSADMIVLLLDDYITMEPPLQKEQRAAHSLAQEGKLIIPVFLKTSGKDLNSPFDKFQRAPSMGKEFWEYESREAAWEQVMKDLRKVVKDVQEKKYLKETELPNSRVDFPQEGGLEENIDQVMNEQFGENYKESLESEIEIQKDDLFDLISKNRTKEVIDLLLGKVPSDSNIFNEIILISARHAKLKRDEMNGVISFENNISESNKILQELVSIIQNKGLSVVADGDRAEKLNLDINKEQLLDLLAKNKIKELLAILMKKIPSESKAYDKVIFLSAWRTRLERDNNLGIVSRDDYNIQMNRLRTDLLNLVQGL